MPTSDIENKQIAKQWIDELTPLRVLDVGTGNGTYSSLARKPEQTWIGIEVYYPYVTEYQLEGKYDEMIIGDARYINYDKLGEFDLIIWGDCIEHLPKDDAKELLNELLKHTEALILAFPVVHYDQEDENNPFEEHLDHWTFEEMTDYLKGKEIESIKGEILAYFKIKGEL